MSSSPEFGEAEREAAGEFFATLDDDELRRIHLAVDPDGNTINWSFRDLLTEEVQRRGLL